ncbi:MAG: hypothetical protein GQ537_06695 [Gammaproteobacteria bacterium]|nr:hypothetical protein [Gammaproteobacteria bacterium]
MEFKVKPVVGDWYQSSEGQEFEVVAIDQDERTVEIQYFDGAIEELDFSSWEQTPLQTAQPPEDWSGSIDMMREDFVADTGMTSQENWASPLDTLDMIDTMAADDYQ